MNTYQDLDKFAHESDEFIERLIEGWYPVKIFPSIKYDQPRLEMADDVDTMAEWCNANCSNDWTTLWDGSIIGVKMNFNFYFKSQEDATHFYLVWDQHINSPSARKR